MLELLKKNRTTKNFSFWNKQTHYWGFCFIFVENYHTEIGETKHVLIETIFLNLKTGKSILLKIWLKCHPYLFKNDAFASEFFGSHTMLTYYLKFIQRLPLLSTKTAFLGLLPQKIIEEKRFNSFHLTIL